ncbi:hypothetical protein [Brachybacterium nesterenkovii]|uniref:hypothetical protein n=1 Tax=Brachybacterium nesterenkovii TaxID=47847 RepID=UPI00321B5DA3
MSLIRSIARPLLAAPFILEGIRTVKTPEREIDVAPAAFAKVDEKLAASSAPGMIDSRTIVRAAGAVAAGAGVMYATNRAPRAAAVLLLATTSIGFANRRKIWELRGEERMNEIQAILTDAGLLGGVLLAIVDTDGSPSVGYRVNKLVERGQKSAAKKQRELERSAKKLQSKVTRSDVRKGAESAQGRASDIASELQETASAALERFTKAYQAQVD